jgi:hypothetical protein
MGSITMATVNALHQGFLDRLNLVYNEDGDWCCHHYTSAFLTVEV